MMALIRRPSTAWSRLNGMGFAFTSEVKRASAARTRFGGNQREFQKRAIARPIPRALAFSGPPIGFWAIELAVKRFG